MRFLGNIEAKIDAKGRAFLPATFRKILQAAGEEGLVLRKDVFQSCLVLYPESVWNEQMDAMRQRLNRWNKQQQQVFRQFVSEVEPDHPRRQRAFPDSQAVSANGRYRTGHQVRRHG